jgi:hypothetical protein
VADVIPPPNGAALTTRAAAFLGVCCIVIAGFLLATSVSDGGTDCGSFGKHKSWDYILKDQRIPSSLYGCPEAFGSRETKVIVAAVAAAILFGVAITISVSNKRRPPAAQPPAP